MQQWFARHPVVSYILIFVLMQYVYNRLFRVKRRLPLLQRSFLYSLMLTGAFMLLIFQVDKLPIIQCFFVTIFLMWLVKIRYFIEKERGRGVNK